MTRPTWSTKGRFIGLRVRNVGGTLFVAGPKDLACSVSPSRSEFKWADVPSERIARSGPISTFDTHIMLS